MLTVDESIEAIAAYVCRRIGGRIPFADLIQAGRIGAWRAECDFNPSMGCTLTACQVSKARYAMWDYVRECCGGQRGLARHAALSPLLASPDRADWLADRYLNRKLVSRALAVLTHAQRLAVQRRFLDEMKLEEIAALYGRSSAWANVKVHKALPKMRCALMRSFPLA